MYKIVLHSSSTGGSREFYVEDSDDRGSLSLIQGESKLEYGVEAIFKKSPFFEHKRLGMTALDAASIIYDDSLAEKFIQDGLNEMTSGDMVDVWDPYPIGVNHGRD